MRDGQRRLIVRICGLLMHPCSSKTPALIYVFPAWEREIVKTSCTAMGYISSSGLLGGLGTLPNGYPFLQEEMIDSRCEAYWRQTRKMYSIKARYFRSCNWFRLVFRKFQELDTCLATRRRGISQCGDSVPFTPEESVFLNSNEP